MLSVRNQGASLPELVGKYLKTAKYALRTFTLVFSGNGRRGFCKRPCRLMANMTHGGLKIWLYVILHIISWPRFYPIDKIIGKIYPFFGATLLFMALGVGGYMLVHGFSGSFQMTELTVSQFKNFHTNPAQNILFPMMFVVISCGAISGFHSTQSPMMARCMTNEKQGRNLFYGAMVAEGIVTLIWATVAINYFGNTDVLNASIAAGHNPAWIVNEVLNTWFGKVGAIIAIIGVVACPITTGDTAFRSARLTLADMFHFKQGPIKNRLIISIPLFVLGYFLSQIEFSTIWKYLGLFNQILSVFMLWTAAMYLVKNKKSHWLLSIPATFMTVVCITYFMVAPSSSGGLALQGAIGQWIGIVLGVLVLAWFLMVKNRISIEVE
jgi:carbon starvation protein CstA